MKNIEPNEHPITIANAKCTFNCHMLVIATASITDKLIDVFPTFVLENCRISATFWAIVMGGNGRATASSAASLSSCGALSGELCMTISR